MDDFIEGIAEEDIPKILDYAREHPGPFVAIVTCADGGFYGAAGPFPDYDTAIKWRLQLELRPDPYTGEKFGDAYVCPLDNPDTFFDLPPESD